MQKTIERLFWSTAPRNACPTCGFGFGLSALAVTDPWFGRASLKRASAILAASSARAGGRAREPQATIAHPSSMRNRDIFPRRLRASDADTKRSSWCGMPPGRRSRGCPLLGVLAPHQGASPNSAYSHPPRASHSNSLTEQNICSILVQCASHSGLLRAYPTFYPASPPLCATGIRPSFELFTSGTPKARFLPVFNSLQCRIAHTREGRIPLSSSPKLGSSLLTMDHPEPPFGGGAAIRRR